MLGWANHEGLWRGHDTTVMARRDDVMRIYNAPSLDAVTPLLDHYGVRYILVGDVEREEHKDGLGEVRLAAGGVPERRDGDLQALTNFQREARRREARNRVRPNLLACLRDFASPR